MREELGLAPDDAILTLVERLRTPSESRTTIREAPILPSAPGPRSEKRSDTTT
jgi:hypothetical protein